MNSEMEALSKCVAELGELEAEQHQIEEVLQESERNLGSLLDSMDGLVFILDKDGTFKNYYQPPRSADLYVSPSEFIGKHFKDVLPPGVAEQLQSAIKAIETSAKTQQFDYVLRMKGGKAWYNTRISPISDKSGAIAGVTGMTRNITERKQAEHNLYERMKELRCLYSITSIAGRPDITLDEVYQEAVWLLPDGWQYPEITCARITLNGKEFKTDNFKTTEWRQLADINVGGCKKGTIEVCYLKARPEIDEGSFMKEERQLIADVARRLGEITERKRAEEQLRQSEEKLRLMFESVTDGITVTGLNGVITEANERTMEMHGVGSKDEILGKSAFELIAQHDHQRAMLNMQKTLEGVSVRNIEYSLLKADGSEFPGELSASVLRDASGNPVGLIAITRDITERREMEEQLIVADRLASVGEMAAGIAHELNNPLTSVIGLSQLLAEEDMPDDTKQDIKAIYSEAQRAAAVVKNLLSFARKHAPARQSTQINNVIEDVLKLRAYEHRVNNIQVNSQLDAGLSEIMVDYFQMQQVFLNIILNAEGAMNEAHNQGVLTINTGRVNGNIMVSVTDDGPGIAKENMSQLFDPFFTTKEVGKGTGLGLSICYGIVGEHGGRIYAESEPGKGATFVIELPVDNSGPIGGGVT